MDMAKIFWRRILQEDPSAEGMLIFVARAASASAREGLALPASISSIRALACWEASISESPKRKGLRPVSMASLDTMA